LPLKIRVPYEIELTLSQPAGTVAYVKKTLTKERRKKNTKVF